jgi:hypothetical protein
MSKKKELLAYTLENKKLDVEIKKEQLEEAKLNVATYRKQIFDRAEHAAYKRIDESLHRTIESQHKDVERLRVWLREAAKREQELSSSLSEQRKTSEVLRSELDSLKNTKAVRLVIWVRSIFNPAPKKSGFSPAAIFCSEPTSVSQLKSIRTATETMSADEFKAKYIDNLQAN